LSCRIIEASAASWIGTPCEQGLDRVDDEHVDRMRAEQGRESLEPLGRHHVEARPLVAQADRHRAHRRARGIVESPLPQVIHPYPPLIPRSDKPQN